MSPTTINLTLLVALALAAPLCVIAWLPSRGQAEASALTVLRVIDLEGRIVSTVRHEDPRGAWALADDVIARTPNPHRLLIEPVLPTRS